MKWIKNLIRKFTFRPKITERITLNRMYQDDTEMKEFIQWRVQMLNENNRLYVISWSDFPADQYGKVELVRNNKVVETAKLMRSKHNLIYWQFNE